MTTENIETLAPTGAGPLAEFLDGWRDATDDPFADARIDDVAAFGTALLRDPALQADAATVAAGYWMRRAELVRMATRFRDECARRPDEVRVAAGRVFHVAPSNVDTLFLYGWTLAHLCGNVSVVRLSRRRGPLVGRILAAFDAAASSRPGLAAASRFVTFEHGDASSGALSAWCSQRVLWGGDEMVEAMRRAPLGPHAGERAFASKFSVAALDAAAYAALDDVARAKLGSAFFNDLFWFDQAACGSPQVVFWVGDEETSRRAASAFADALEAEVLRRGHVVDDALANGRALAAFRLALRHDARVAFGRAGVVTAELGGVGEVDRETATGGLLRTVRVASLDDVLPLLGDADQTVAHFGFDAERLRAFALAAGARGLDRVVPIGRALAFTPTWDGFDLIEDFTRRVSVVV